MTQAMTHQPAETETPGTPQKLKGAVAMVMAARPALIEACKGGPMSGEMVVSLMLNAFRKAPRLLECDRASIMAGLLTVARAGLPFNTSQNFVSLIPYGRDCGVVFGYPGLIALAKRSGGLVDLRAAAVYEGEHFKVREGTDPGIEHIPDWRTVPRWERLVATYCTWQSRGATGWNFRVANRTHITEIRADALKKAKGRPTPWESKDEGEVIAMAIKTAIRYASQWWDVSGLMASAFSERENAEHWGAGSDDGTPGVGPVTVTETPEEEPLPQDPRLQEQDAKDAAEGSAFAKDMLGRMETGRGS